MKYALLLLLACTTAFAAERGQGPNVLQMNEDIDGNSLRAFLEAADYTICCGCCEEKMEAFIITHNSIASGPISSDIFPNDTSGFLRYQCCDAINVQRIAGGCAGTAGLLFYIGRISAELSCKACTLKAGGCCAAAAVAYTLLDRRFKKIKNDPKVQQKRRRYQEARARQALNNR